MATPFSLHDFASRHTLAPPDPNQQHHTPREEQHIQNELRILDRLPGSQAPRLFDAEDLPAQDLCAQPAQQHAQETATNQSDHAKNEAAAQPSSCQPETPVGQTGVKKRKASSQDQALACKRDMGTEQDVMEVDLEEEEELKEHVLKSPGAMLKLANECKQKNWPEFAIEQLNSILSTCYRDGHDGVIKLKGKTATWRSYSSFAQDGKEWAHAFAAYHKASVERANAGIEPIQAEPGAPDPTQIHCTKPRSGQRILGVRPQPKRAKVTSGAKNQPKRARGTFGVKFWPSQQDTASPAAVPKLAVIWEMGQEELGRHHKEQLKAWCKAHGLRHGKQNKKDDLVENLFQKALMHQMAEDDEEEHALASDVHVTADSASAGLDGRPASADCIAPAVHAGIHSDEDAEEGAAAVANAGMSEHSASEESCSSETDSSDGESSEASSIAADLDHPHNTIPHQLAKAEHPSTTAPAPSVDSASAHAVEDLSLSGSDLSQTLAEVQSKLRARVAILDTLDGEARQARLASSTAHKEKEARRKALSNAQAEYDVASLVAAATARVAKDARSKLQNAICQSMAGCGSLSA